MPLLTIGTALGSKAVSSIFGASQARKERRANRQAEEDARQHNIKMWNMQNEYNHPSAQMARLQEAGLNPNMIYGTPTAAATGQAGDVAKGNAPEQSYYKDLDFDALTPLVQHQNIEQSKAQVDNLRVQNTVLTQEANLKAAQRANTLVNTARSDFDYMLAKELRDTSLQAAQNEVKLQQESIIGRQIDNHIKDATKANQIKKIALDIQNAQETLTGQQLKNQLMRYDEELRQYGVERNDAIYWRVLGRFINENFGPGDVKKSLDGWLKYRNSGSIMNFFK